MSYNIFAETNKRIDWEELNKRVVLQMFIEYIPMPGMGNNGGDALGISIPSRNLRNGTWEELKRAMEILKTEFQFELYDMYLGTKIDSKVMDKIKQNLIIQDYRTENMELVIRQVCK